MFSQSARLNRLANDCHPLVIGIITVLAVAKNISFAVRMEILALGFLAIVPLRPITLKLSRWIDRRFDLRYFAPCMYRGSLFW